MKTMKTMKTMPLRERNQIGDAIRQSLKDRLVQIENVVEKSDHLKKEAIQIKDRLDNYKTFTGNERLLSSSYSMSIVAKLATEAETHASK